MAKKPRNYWRERFEQLEKAQHERTLFYYADLYANTVVKRTLKGAAHRNA